VGNTSITASYSGDTNNAPSTSPVLVQVVQGQTSSCPLGTITQGSPTTPIAGNSFPVVPAAVLSYAFQQPATQTYYGIATAEYGSQPDLRTLSISATPCGPALPGLSSVSTNAQLTWVVAGSSNPYGYPTLPAGGSFYATAYPKNPIDSYIFNVSQP
jgi:hypothetical protein